MTYYPNIEYEKLSSEDLSDYSYVLYDATLNVSKGKIYNCSNTGREKTFSTKTENLKKLNQLSQQNRLRKNTEALDHLANKKSAIKINSKSCEKNSLKVSTRKLKLAERQPKIGSLSTRSTASRNLFSSKKKQEPCQQLFKLKKNEKCARKNSVSETSDAIKCNSARKMREIMEIEVFMPFIDVDRNRIVYPVSKKPNVKRYFANENGVLKLKENIRQGNMCFGKKNRENTARKYLHSKIKKDLEGNLNKNTSKPRRESNGANIIKSSTLMKRRESATDLKLSNLEDLGEGSFDAEIRDLPENVAKKTKNLFGSDVLDCSNMDLEDSEKSNVLRESLRNKKKNHSSKQNFKNIHELIYQSTEKLPMDATRDFTEANNCFPCCMEDEKCTKENAQLTRESNKQIKKHVRKRTNELSSSDVSTKEIKPYKLVSLNELALGAEKSISSINQISNKIKENSWRRTLPANSSRRLSGPDKWRRKGEDNELSMQSWIERCKYLQARDQSSQKSRDRNPWRRTS